MSSSDTDSPEYGNHKLVSLTLTPDDDESLNVLNDSATTYPNRLYANLHVKRRQIKFQIETGAMCNVIRRQDVPIATRLEQTKQVLTLYDGSRIEPLGRCTLEVRDPKNGNVFRSEFVVVDDAGTESIIGVSSAQEMGLIQLSMENVQAVTTQQKQQRHKTKPMTKESVMQKYPLAPQIFQERLNTAIQGIRGVYTVADDILIIGKGSTEAIAREDHDKNLTALLDRCQEKGIELNGEKCQIATQKVKYMGHVLSSDGLMSDSAKIEAIQKMPRPTNVAGIRRFIGMTGYLSRFLDHLSDLCKPLRQLTKQSIQWQWNEEHQQAFDKIKAAVTQTPVLQYFDGKLPTTIQCDASQTGLGAVLMQSRGPIAYASRALTETEKQYAQIEKEMLAIVYAMQKFHTYT